MIRYCIDLSRIYLQEEKYTCKHLWITFLYADVIHWSFLMSFVAYLSFFLCVCVYYTYTFLVLICLDF